MTSERTHVLLTGAAGFVGSHMLARLLRDTEWIIHCPVSFRHRGNPDRIAQVLRGAEQGDDLSGATARERVRIDLCDLSAPISPTMLDRWKDCRYVLNVASSSHVDRSITDPGPFILNNTALMVNVLDAAREMPGLEMFLQMSTDEVYGPAEPGRDHAEWETILPSNPYSASKAAQEAIAFSYWRTYGIPLVITNTMNIIAERQDAEKFLPLVIKKLLCGEKITVHASKTGESGSRFYLDAANLADAWLHIVETARDSDYSLVQHYADGFDRPTRYNVVGEREIKNDELVRTVAYALALYGKLPGVMPDVDGMARTDTVDAFIGTQIEYVDFHSSRPGHDLRYALNGAKIRSELDWTPPIPLTDSILRTVRWYLDNPEWLAG